MSAAGWLSLAASGTIGTAASHEPPAAEAKALAGFELRTDELVREGEDIAALSRAVDKTLREGLQQHAVALGEATAPKLRLQLRWLDYDRSDYAGAFELQTAGSDAWTTAAKFECFACSNTALAKRAREVLPEALRVAARRPDPEKPATTGTPAPAAGRHPDTGATPPGAAKPRRALGGLGKGGIAMLAIGVVGVGVGAGLVARKSEESRDAELLIRTDTAPAGIGLLAGGGALAIVGIALLATDRVRAKRRPVAVTPAATPRFIGLAIAGRF
ncbi:MAG: hypothetical protein U0168_14855 [Nannocystaceae bacterium]